MSLAELTYTQLYIVAIAHIAAIPALIYPFVYRRSPWKKGPTGKALMNMARSLALLFAVGDLGFWWPFPGYDQIYAAVLTYLAFAITYQLVVMYRLVKRGREREREQKRADQQIEAQLAYYTRKAQP